MTSEQVSFPGSSGANLAARFERPVGAIRATALFAHCFTCSKDSHAASRISRALAGLGVATLRFDFTGLGGSEGDFANTGFSSNVGDLVAAAEFLKGRGQAARLLVGHSLGGAAVLAAAPRIPEATAVATIGAPAEPAHVRHLIAGAVPEVESKGSAEVAIGGRRFRITKGFLDDIGGHRLTDAISGLKRALLVFHSPTDDTVGIDNATKIFVAAKHPKSFVSLAGADHLLTRPEDAGYVASVLAAWAARYVPELSAPAVAEEAPPEGWIEVRETRSGRFAQRIRVGRHLLSADEPASVGGGDTGPGPYDLLSAALGACTSMTMRMYAERKGWPLERATVRLRHEKVHAADCADCETKPQKIDRIERSICLEGPLDDEQRRRLLEIADKCPVHQTLHRENEIVSRLEE
ncbi:MAG: osmotically inducible protein C [Alphaproteobacteria bacterium]|nr:osmotically inducible protein C [Alphaproteobacteria bacterium]